MSPESLKRSEWFVNDRFGMFIHWGLYAIPARGEWVASHEEMDMEIYKDYFNDFNPIKFDPKEWAKLAKKAGMKYVVMTAKHHDGFCLFDSKYTDYKSTKTKYGKDIVREYLEAFRAEGIKVGLYFSIIDWSHPDFPAYKDRQHPMRNNEAYKDKKIDFDNYLKYMHAQVEELVTGYGKIDIMWFDFSYDDMKGEKWQATKLLEMVRKHQPDIITDNRLEGAGDDQGSIMTDNPLPYAGDFACPEQVLPPGGVKDLKGNPIPWELCCTINNNWGYNNTDHCYKSPKLLIRSLVECVSKGGNMLLNVGPDAKGRIPKKSAEILEKIGEWMEDNGESIYGAGICELPKPEWGRYTKKGDIIYAHVFEETIGSLALTGIGPDKVKRVFYEADGSEVRRGEAWNTAEYTDVAFVSFGENPAYSYPLPDEIDTVLRIELK